MNIIIIIFIFIASLNGAKNKVEKLKQDSTMLKNLLSKAISLRLVNVKKVEGVNKIESEVQKDIDAALGLLPDAKSLDESVGSDIGKSLNESDDTAYFSEISHLNMSDDNSTVVTTLTSAPKVTNAERSISEQEWLLINKSDLKGIHMLFNTFYEFSIIFTKFLLLLLLYLIQNNKFVSNK